MFDPLLNFSSNLVFFPRPTLDHPSAFTNIVIIMITTIIVDKSLNSCLIHRITREWCLNVREVLGLKGTSALFTLPAITSKTWVFLRAKSWSEFITLAITSKTSFLQSYDVISFHIKLVAMARPIFDVLMIRLKLQVWHSSWRNWQFKLIPEGNILGSVTRWLFSFMRKTKSADLVPELVPNQCVAWNNIVQKLPESHV